MRENLSRSTLDYLENPEGWREFGTPFDVYMEERMLTHRLMRLAFEAGADWLVEVLEREREKSASQAAYALVLDREGQPSPDEAATGRGPSGPRPVFARSVTFGGCADYTDV